MRNPSLLSMLCLWAGCVEISYAVGGGGDCQEFTCLWQTEQGAIEQTDSWHEKAIAYRLNGTPARISREVDLAAMPKCLEVSLIANVAKDAQFEVQYDFGNDGSIDARSAVEPGLWEPHSLYLRTPASVRHLRVHLAKQGPGEAAVEYISLLDGDRDGVQHCATLPALTLANGSVCLDDATCGSGHCVLGECSACGAGGCAEGSACRENKDCIAGACAAGVCRACAASGSCGQGEGCSASEQCAFGSCVPGLKPSLIQYPELDGICGECKSDPDCASGHCVLGQCAECVDNSDCNAGQRCRFDDVFEGRTRSCVPRFDSVLPRGALCEEDVECEGGLRCAAAAGRAKRCGFSCKLSSECAADEVCGSPGSLPSTTQAGIHELLPSYRETNARITTCYRKVPPRTGWDVPRCEISAQCPSGKVYGVDVLSACCENSCGVGAVDLQTGECVNSDYQFVQMNYESR